MSTRNLDLILVIGFALLFSLFFVFSPLAVEPAYAIESCVPIDFGNPPALGSLGSAGEVDCYTFYGIPGNMIRVDIETTSGDMTPYWQVLQPDDTVLCDWKIIGPTDCPVGTEGTHKIYVKDFGDTDLGTYRIFVQRLDDPVNCPIVTFGASPVSGSISVATQENCYTFDGKAGDIIRLDVEATSGALTPYWQVLHDGNVVCDWEIIPPTDCQLVSDGLHRVMIKDFAGTNTGAYRFYIQRLNNPVGCKTVKFGAVPVGSSIAYAAQEKCFTFYGKTGDVIRLDVEATSGGLTPYWQAIQPNGTVECDWEIISPSDCTLLSTGIHTIMVRDFAGTNVGSFKLFIQRLNNPVGCKSITYGGSAKDGKINSAAQENCFRFDGQNGDHVEIHFFKVSGSLTPYWQVVQQNGTVICDWEIINPSDCLLSSGGTHTIMVRDFAGTKSGEYYITICTNKTHCTLVLIPLPVSTGALDGWILESGEFSNKGGKLNRGGTTLRLGDNGQDKQFRTILSFNTSGLPDTAVVTKATLKIKKQGVVGTNPFKILGGLKVDIRKGVFSGSKYLQIKDFQAWANKNGVSTFGKYPNKYKWYSANLYKGALPYINKTWLTQFRLRFKLDDNNDNSADYMKFFSGNAVWANRPKLIVEYYLP